MNESLRSLKHKLRHYYEIDIHNCTMTHDDWITELSSAMVDPDYYQKFMREYNEYKADRWIECDTCYGEHFIVSNDEEGNEQVQKCDDCNIFETDADAQHHYNEFH